MALKSANQPIRLLKRIGTWVANTWIGARVVALVLFLWSVLKSLLNIKEEDELLEGGKNAGGFLARFGTYLYMDSVLAVLAPAIVTTVKYHGLSFPWVFLAVWAFGFVAAGAFVLYYEKTGKDLSIGTDLRRAQDTLRKGSLVAAILFMTWLVLKWSFWTGPEQVVTFFRKELRTLPLIVLVLLILTAIQSVFWAAFYSAGYDGYSEMVRAWFN